MKIGKFLLYFNEIKNQIWFLPTILTVLAIAVSFILLYIDSVYIAQINRNLPWLFTGTADAARGLLSTISGSLITVISIAFSITIVALQQASTQFSPRILRTFTKSRGNQIVLGVYIATFTYSLLILRAIRTGNDMNIPSYVPSLSISFALILTLICLGLLIYFIFNISHTLEVSEIIKRVHKDLLNVIDQKYEEGGAGGSRLPESSESLIRKFHKSKKDFYKVSENFGFVQKIDIKALLKMKQKNTNTILITPMVGDFVSGGDKIIIADKKLDEKTQNYIYGSISLNSDRSEEQDPLFGIKQIVDIALKALSPGINDPTTAEYCIYYLANAIKHLSKKNLPQNKIISNDGKTTFILQHPTWKNVIEESFSQIIYNSRKSTHVVHELLKELSEIREFCSKDKKSAITAELIKLRNLKMKFK